MSLGELSEHRAYWADDVKIDRYRRALSAVIRSDSVVLDLGCGTGLLGLLAVQAGARRVYAVDAGSIIALAAEIAVANGAADRITYVHGWSSAIDLPEPVDVIVADQIGGLAYEPGVFGYYADARSRFLKPGGVCIPDAFSFMLAPVSSTELDTEIEFWRTECAGFDVSAAVPYASNSVHHPQLSESDLLAAPVLAGRRNSWIDEPISLDATFTVERSGKLQAIGGLFEAEMSHGVMMSNNPLSPDHMRHRWNSLYPLPRPMDVKVGDQITAHVDIDLDDERAIWQVTVGGEGPTFRQSTFFDSFLTSRDFERTARSYVPSSGSKAQLWRAGLDLIADGHSIAELESELATRFPGELRSPASARRFVNQLVAAVDG